jgi:DNA primase
MYTRDRRTHTNLYSKEQIKRVLTGAGISIENEVDTDFIIFCPFHSNFRTPAGEVDKTSGFFFCFSCQKVADLTELVMNTSKRTYFEAARYIKSKEVATDLETQIAQQLHRKPDYIEFDEFTIKRLAKAAKETLRSVNYYKYRQIELQSLIKFELGYSEKQDMVTIPVHSPDGICVGFVGRSVEGKEFKNTPDLPKSKVLFNLHRVKNAQKVYVVESSFDAIRLDQCGLPAVATLGSMVSNAQIDLLKKYFNDIVLLADNDEAGRTMKDKLAERLGSRLSVIKLDEKFKDIGDMDDEAIKKLEYRFDTAIISMLN